MWFRVVVLLAVLSVVVRCELDRRDVHRIVLKPERSKKSNKKHHHSSKHHHHKPHSRYRDSEAHASSYPSEETPYFYDTPVHKPHHRYQNHHEEYHELTKPRPPSKENNYYSYPEEEKFPSKHFRKDMKDIWNPMSSQKKPSSRKPSSSFDFSSSNKNTPRRKSTIKPSALSEMIDITTDKPRKYPLPILSASQFEPSMTLAKKPLITPESLIPKDFGLPEHSYEVHEDFVETRTMHPPTNFGNFSPLMGNYLSNLKTPQPFLPTTVPFISANIYRNNGDFGLRTRPQNVQTPF